jgi:dihydrofolate reductase
MTAGVMKRGLSLFEIGIRKETSMRKVTFGGASSLDNYIARKDDSYDWLMWCKEAGEIMRDYWKTIDTMLMGRRTYEVALSHGPLPVHNARSSNVAKRD